ncbi:MAG: hypothetical protein GY696_36630 [Gammaproteobacteria bacterium]|nr:hypothetical protein [Gammaproteobacteria bacterium]
MKSKTYFIVNNDYFSQKMELAVPKSEDNFVTPGGISTMASEVADFIVVRYNDLSVYYSEAPALVAGFDDHLLKSPEKLHYWGRSLDNIDATDLSNVNAGREVFPQEEITKVMSTIHNCE